MDAILRGGRLKPDARHVVAVEARRLDPERADRLDERALEQADVALDVRAVALQVEDRVADELARPVVGRLAAAVRFHDLGLDPGRDVELSRVCAAAERDHRRMLEEEDRVGPRARGDVSRDRPLELPGLHVRHAAELQDVRGDHGARVLRRSRRDARALDEVLLMRADDGLEPGVRAQAPEEPAHVVANGVDRDPERGRDPLRRVARRPGGAARRAVAA